MVKGESVQGEYCIEDQVPPCLYYIILLCVFLLRTKVNVLRISLFVCLVRKSNIRAAPCGRAHNYFKINTGVINSLVE